jgi:hypothetical protein
MQQVWAAENSGLLGMGRMSQKQHTCQVQALYKDGLKMYKDVNSFIGHFSGKSIVQVLLCARAQKRLVPMVSSTNLSFWWRFIYLEKLLISFKLASSGFEGKVQS